MHIVIRKNFTSDMATILADDIDKACQFLEQAAKLGATKIVSTENDLAKIC